MALVELVFQVNSFDRRLAVTLMVQAELLALGRAILGSGRYNCR